MKTKFIFTLLLLTLTTSISFSQKKTKNTPKTTSAITNVKISQDIKEIYQKFIDGPVLNEKFIGEHILSNNNRYRIFYVTHNNLSIVIIEKFNFNSNILTFCVFNKTNLDVLINFGKYNSYGLVYKVYGENRYLLEVSKDSGNNRYPLKHGLYDLSKNKEIVSCNTDYEFGPSHEDESSYSIINDYIYELNSDNTINFHTDSKSLSNIFDVKKNKFVNTIGITKSNNNNNSSNPCANSNIPPIYEDYGWKNNKKSLSFRKDNGNLDFINITYNGEYYGGTKWFKTESEAIRAEYMYQKYGCH